MMALDGDVVDVGNFYLSGRCLGSADVGLVQVRVEAQGFFKAGEIIGREKGFEGVYKFFVVVEVF